MKSLDKRIAILEKKLAPIESIAIVCTFVSVGWQKEEAFARLDDKGAILSELPRKSEDAFSIGGNNSDSM
jgi:hypothetical protein